MGNKNSSSSSKKQTRIQIYQQEQLNKIEKEVQESNSLVSLKSSFRSYQINNDNNLIRQNNQQIINPLDIKPEFPNQQKEQQILHNDPVSDIPINYLNISKTSDKRASILKRQYKTGLNVNRRLNEIDRKETKLIIVDLENHLSSLIRNENYFSALEKLFEILYLNKKAFGNNTEQVAFTMHRMSSILCLLGRLEEALKYEYESCQIRKNIIGGLDVNIAKSFIYIAKLLWYFKKYIQSFYYILEAYNISEHPQNCQYLELKLMIGEVSLEMSNIAHENEEFILSFKLRILSFQSKRSAFLLDESYLDDDISMLAHEVWNYKQGIFLLQMIPTKIYSQNLPNTLTNFSQNQEESCPICYIEFTPGDLQKELLCCHIFHPICIDRWIIKNQKCPMCRKKQELLEYLNNKQNSIQKLQDQSKKRVKSSKTKNVNEIVQLSPRTSATFDILQNELQNQEIDIFMLDYNQHFNILPLTHNNSHKNNVSQQVNNDSKQNDYKQNNNLLQNKNSLQIQKSLNQDDQLLVNILNKEQYRNSNGYDEYQFTIQKNQQNKFNLCNHNQSCQFNIKAINQQQPKYQFEINQEYEEEEESKHHYLNNDDSESDYYYKKQNFYESDCKQLRVSDVFIKNTNDKIIQYQQYSNSHQIQSYENEFNYQQENKYYIQQNDRQNYSPQHEKFSVQQNLKIPIQQFNVINDEKIENDEIYGEYDDDSNDFLDQSQSIIQIKQIKHIKKFHDNNIPNIFVKDSQLDLSQEIDFRNKGILDESLFIEQNSFSVQPQIRDSMNNKQLQNRYLYFEQDQQAQNDSKLEEQSQQEFKNPINQKDPKFNKTSFNLNSNNTNLQQLNNNTVSQNREKLCSQSCYCCKNIDDEDVNFDEEGISESNNQIYATNDLYQENNNNLNLISQRLQQNLNFKFDNNINQIQQKNLAQKLSQSYVFKQKQQTQEEKLTINNMPHFLSKNTSNNNSNNNYDNKGKYMNDNSDIFDKKPITKFNNQKIDLFEDEEKENKFIFDNNITNNNKYMNHY